MNTNLVIGLVVGIVVAAWAVYFILRARGYFQYMGGRKRSSIPPVNKEMLTARLLDLNDLSSPFSVVEGTETDLVAEWKPASPLAGDRAVTRAYRALMFLDEARHTVRCYEQSGEIRWEKSNDGLRPAISYRRRFIDRGVSAQEADSGLGSFSRIKASLLARVRESGWEWVTVSNRRHATYSKVGANQLPAAK